MLSAIIGNSSFSPLIKLVIASTIVIVSPILSTKKARIKSAASCIAIAKCIIRTRRAGRVRIEKKERDDKQTN